MNIFGNLKKHTTQLTPGLRPRIAYSPESIEQRKQIERLLTFYDYPYTTTIYGDILVSVPGNAIESLNVRSIISKITGIKPDNVKLVSVPALSNF